MCDQPTQFEWLLIESMYECIYLCIPYFFCVKYFLTTAFYMQYMHVFASTENYFER